jgi:hypothetical protein
MGKPSQEVRTAFHEAGHAVVNLVLGLPLKNLFIKWDGDKIGGRCTSSYTVGVDTDEHIVACLAGQAAENILLGVDHPDLYGTDRRHVAALFKFKFRKTATANDLKPYHNAARRLVRKHARLIGDVALMLLVQHEVDPRTVSRLVAKRAQRG